MDSEKVAADGPMGHRRLCKDFGWDVISQDSR